MDEGRLDEAKERIKHVVVLMLENRSYDHMFGYLDPTDPRYECLHDGDHPNRTGLRGANPKLVGVNSDGRHVLQRDPPHGHASVTMQMGRRRRGGRLPMNGFIRAYALKLAGREQVPVIHWLRLDLLLIPIACLASGVANGATMKHHWVFVALGVLAVVVLLESLLGGIPRLVGKPRWLFAVAEVGIGYLCVAGVWGAVERVQHDGWRKAAIFGLVTFAGLTLLLMILQAYTEIKRRSVSNANAVPAARLRIMRCMRPAVELPVLSQLATQFAVCTRWFSSVPGATWPNRNFIHAGTSDRSVDIEIGLYDSKTIFQVLDEEHPDGLSYPAWRIYHDRMAQVFAFPWVWRNGNIGRCHTIADLATHAAADSMATYSFIEPRHSGRFTNSQHPGNGESNTPDANGDETSNDFRRSEQLVRDVFEALRPRLDDSLLIITHDEHGGFFDRQSPPKAKAPTPIKGGGRKAYRLTTSRRIVSWFVEHRNTPFHFRRYGVRVPAVVVSAWIQPGTVISDELDHTSVIATLQRLFAPKHGPLNQRDKSARSLHSIVLDNAHRALPDLPPPPDDDNGPAKDLILSARRSPILARLLIPQKPAPARSFDGDKPAQPGAIRVDSELEEQLKALETLVKPGLQQIERDLPTRSDTNRDDQALDIPSRLELAAQATRDAHNEPL